MLGRAPSGCCLTLTLTPHNKIRTVSTLPRAQAAEKLVLAEGSKLVLVATQSAAQQGVYGLASNLGSLVVRTVFQPFEEAAFLAFARPGGGGGGGGGGSGAVRSLRRMTLIEQQLLSLYFRLSCVCSSIPTSSTAGVGALQ